MQMPEIESLFELWELFMRLFKEYAHFLLFVFLVMVSAIGCDHSDHDNDETTNQRLESSVNLTLTQKQTGNGFITPVPGVYAIEPDTPFPVKAIPSPGFVFSGWALSGNGSIEDPKAPKTTLTLSGDAMAEALFAPEVALTLRISPDDCGFTLPMSNNTIKLGSGDTIDIKADPATGYHFFQWRSGTGGTIADMTAPETTVTVSGDCEITAEFEENIVKFNGITNAGAYAFDDAQTGKPKAMARLVWPEAVSPFCVHSDDFTYLIYQADSSTVDEIYQPENLVKQLNGALKAEIEINPDQGETFFLVVAEDLEGNRSKNFQVVSVRPGSAFEYYDGAPPIDLLTLDTDDITVVADENKVTLHGGDWRYLFTDKRDFILHGDGPVLTKERRNVAFDGQNTIIEYEDISFRDIVKNGEFQIFSSLPLLNRLPMKTRDAVVDNPDLSDIFAGRLASFDRIDVPVYISPDGNMMVWEPEGDISRGNRLATDIPITDNAYLHLVINPSLSIKTRQVKSGGVTDVFDINIKGNLKFEAILRGSFDGQDDFQWGPEKLLEKNVEFLFMAGALIPIHEEFSFFINTRLNVSLDEGTSVRFKVGTKLYKKIDMGLKYIRGSGGNGWSIYYNEDHHCQIPFDLDGNAKTDTILEVTPTFSTTFENSASATLKLFSQAHLQADFDFNPLYLTQCDLDAAAYIQMECDFKPFDVLLAYDSRSHWLFRDKIYALPKTQFYDVIPPVTNQEPRLLKEIAVYDITDGVNNPRQGSASWVLEKQLPDGGGWSAMPNFYISPQYPLVTAIGPSSDIHEYTQTMDLYIDEALESGIYRILVTSNTQGFLGNLDTRKNEIQFEVFQYDNRVP